MTQHDSAIQHALETDRLVDITATGRKSGRPRRFEIMLRRHAGRLYIVGRPEPKGWYANMLADPAITLHLKESVQADLSARAEPILDMAERRPILTDLLADMDMVDDMDAWIASSAWTAVTV